MGEFSAMSHEELAKFIAQIPEKKKGVVVRMVHCGKTYAIQVPEKDRVTPIGKKVDAVMYGNEVVLVQELDKAIYGTFGGGVDDKDDSVSAAAQREMLEEMVEIGVTAQDLLLFAGIINESAHEIPIIVLQWIINQSGQECFELYFNYTRFVLNSLKSK